MNNNRALIGTTLLTAIASSLCCITPVLALIAGAGGAASSFSWIEPARPFLMGFTVLVLGFAWYQKLKPKKAETDDCGCETPAKTSFFQTKKFLGFVTAFAALLMAFPAYSHIFYPKVSNEVVVADKANIIEANFTVVGMTCGSCENHVNHALRKQAGVIEANSSYDNGSATVKFDQSQTDIEKLKTALETKTGYEVTEHKLKR